MPGAAQHTNICTGHGCFPPRPNNQASTNVFVNLLGWHRVGDTYEDHHCGKHWHGGFLADGSSTVFVNSKEAGRILDPVSCGSAVGRGSKNVFAGG